MYYKFENNFACLFVMPSRLDCYIDLNEIKYKDILTVEEGYISAINDMT